MPIENLLPVPSSPEHLSRDHFASPTQAPVEPKPPEQWDGAILTAISEVTNRYQIESKIGSGASAEIYRAIDTRIKRFVAIKRYNKETLESSPAESDYLSEFDAISKIAHPNVVCAYDVDDDDEGPFIVFEHLEGINLEQKLTQGPMEANEARHFLVQALEALTAIHEQGFSHLDIKPANFMETPTLRGFSHYTLIDFGRACDPSRERKRRESKEQKTLRGSLYYMAPEQFNNEAQDQRTDLYALGAMTYELLTGIKPFDGESPVQVMAAHLTNRVTPIGELLPELPPGMAPLIMSLITKDPEARPQSAKEALRCLLSLSSIQFSPLKLASPFPHLVKTA